MVYEPFKVLTHAEASYLQGSLGGMSVISGGMKRDVYALKELSLCVRVHGLCNDINVFTAICHAYFHMNGGLRNELGNIDDEGMSRNAVNLWRHHFLSQAFTGEILFTLVADKEKRQLTEEYQEELNTRFIEVFHKLADKKFSDKVGDILWVSYQGRKNRHQLQEVWQAEIFKIPRL